MRICGTRSTVLYRMAITPDEILTALLIAAVVLLLIVLYHVLFIVVDLRKVMRRVEGVSNQVEEIIMKPLVMTDKILEWVLEYIESFDKAGHKKHHEKHKTIDVE